MCAQWNCTDGRMKCLDGLECIPVSWVCDGSNWPAQGCRDGSDEDPTKCSQWDCNTGLENTLNCESANDCTHTKCADNLQCLKRTAICDGKFDCKDRSDELCNDVCHAIPLKPWEEDIVKKCKEDMGRCVSVKQYCDGIAQCPDASDETQAGCTCEDWGLTSCTVKDTGYCMNTNWVQKDSLNQSAFECGDFSQTVNIMKYRTGMYD